MRPYASLNLNRDEFRYLTMLIVEFDKLEFLTAPDTDCSAFILPRVENLKLLFRFKARYKISKVVNFRHTIDTVRHLTLQGLVLDILPYFSKLVIGSISYCELTSDAVVALKSSKKLQTLDFQECKMNSQ